MRLARWVIIAICTTSACIGLTSCWSNGADTSTSVVNDSPLPTSSTVAWDAHITIDQFGYRPHDKKIGVISNPQIGYNAHAHFNPGQRYEVRRWNDHTVVHTGIPASWHNGTIDEASGDRGWWFDFSELSIVGDYYIYDVDNAVRSAHFTISNNPYRDVLRSACRMFYYNRANQNKSTPWADSRWCDSAGHLGPNQDRAARAIWAPDDSQLIRDCSGGWYDAGDQNKYVTFMSDAVHSLLSSWHRRPALWTSLSFNIPESSNDIPDLVDEIMVGLQFVMRMQDKDGGVFIKVGCRDYNDTSPPSADKRPRFYGPKATSSTIAAASMFAHAAWSLSNIPQLAAERRDFITRAVQAWSWYHARRDHRDTNADTQDIKSGDADRSLDEQDGEAVVAAIYLFATTGEQSYHQWIHKHYRELQPWHDVRWGMWRNSEGTAISDYAALPNAQSALANLIRTKRHYEISTTDIYQFSNPGLYRADHPSPTWGSNRTLCDIGQTLLEIIPPGFTADQEKICRERALNIVHYLHGVNPQSMVYLSNMRELGAERSVDRLFHAWFAPKTLWSDASTGPGPAPGYLVGGPHLQITSPLLVHGTQELLNRQPPQKAYTNDNTGPDIWAITEPAIYYQAAYIELLASFTE